MVLTIHIGHLRSLATNQRCMGLLTARDDASQNGFDPLLIRMSKT